MACSIRTMGEERSVVFLQAVADFKRRVTDTNCKSSAQRLFQIRARGLRISPETISEIELGLSHADKHIFDRAVEETM